MASGNTLLIFEPGGAIPPSTNYATLDLRNGHLVGDYDATTEETLTWECVLPRHYAGGGITVRIAWMATSATSGGVTWGASFERHQASTDDLDSDSYAAEQTASGTAPGTSGQVLYTDIVLTDGAQLDSLAVGEHFRFKLARKVADAGDTMSGDAELLSVELRES